MSYQSPYGQPQQPQFPVSVEGWDPNTINHQLPQGNDIWPNIDRPPALPVELIEAVVAEFRYYVQSRVDKSPLNILTYNLFAQNYFNNPYYVEWVQRTLDFTEFLVTVQRQPYEVAKDKAITYMFGGVMAANAAQYPVLFQALPADGQNAIYKSGQLLDDIIGDLDAYLQSGRRQPTATPMVQSGYGGQPQMNPSIGQGTIPRGQGARIHHGGVAQSSTSIATAAPAGGRYTAQSWDANKPTETTPRSQTVQSNGSGYVKRPEPVIEEDPNLTIPSSKDEIIIDPTAYVPNGVNIDQQRPYDVIYAPGGIELRPYHLSPYTRTKNDITPYAQGYDPSVYCLYHVRWPDGMVEELLVPWSSSVEMSYLKHEIDDRLRGNAIQPNKGKRIASSSLKILNLDGPTTPMMEMAPKAEEEPLATQELRPVFVEGVFTGSTDVENEAAVRQVMMETLQLEESDGIPAHEYLTTKVYPIFVDDECQMRLLAFSDSESLTHVAHGLSEAVADGCLPLRDYRVFNDRLTTYINTCLKENLSLETEIESFVEDIRDLFDHLRGKGMPDAVENIASRAVAILKRVMNLRVEILKDEDDEDAPPEERLYLVDEYINIQTGWDSEQLLSLNIDKEPVLVSKATHPNIHRVIDEALKRHAENKTIAGKQVRLITSDGVYLEVFRGWLVGGSILIKKLS